MKMLLMMTLILSTLFMKSSHPVSLMAIILIQTMMLCMLIWVAVKLNWFSYILFLIFLGGLMVLFVYISSLASNEMFLINIKNTILSNSILFIFTVGLMTYMANNQFTHEMIETPKKSFTSIYSMNMITPSMMTMIYLLLTLIVVVKMTSRYEGPLRNMIFK